MHDISAWIAVDRDTVYLRYCYVADTEAIANCLSWQASPVLNAAEALFLCGGNQLAIHNKASRRITMEGV